MTAAACCTSNPILYQIQVISSRSQCSTVLSRTTLSSSTSSASSSSSPVISISEIRRPIGLSKVGNNDVNNNDCNHHSTTTVAHKIFDLTDDDELVNNVDEEQFLALVGLRRKTKTPPKSIPTLGSLTKRLATPICLLPLPKYAQRVRQALYVLLPFLKFVSFIHDAEYFCVLNDQVGDSCLSKRSVTQSSSSQIISKQTSKRKVSKSEFITMAANTFRNNNAKKTPAGQYIHSVLKCSVVLHRLNQFSIDQIMKNAIYNNTTNISISSKNKRPLRGTPQLDESSSPKTQRILDRTITKTKTTRTTITTTTTEKTTVKQKSTMSYNDTKRFKKASNHEYIDLFDNNQSKLTYQRIYLKCFVCSKREFINAQATNSDILHSHWLEHGHDLSLNIYDSEIDSILTRVVEFFSFPKRHSLEGKIQTVFILNSKEIRKTPASSVDDDACIVID